MKLNRTEPKWLLTLILVFHVTSTHAEASRDDDDDDVRILIVGIRGDSRFSAAEILSGRKAGGQEDREIVQTPVITDEGRRMMLVTGPNLCEEDTARQSFTTAQFLSAPGPHAVLMVLNLEDQESEQCDVVKRAQELLGAEVLQHCIVLLHQNHQERLTGASRGIAGEMINACGGRFHMIRDSEPKPVQTAALLAQIHKLVWLNGGKLNSALNEKQLKSERLELLKRVKEIEQILIERDNQNLNYEHLFFYIYDNLGGAAGIIGWSFLVSLTTLVIYTNGEILSFKEKCALLVLFMVCLRYALSPDVAIPLNLALITSLATVLTDDAKSFLVGLSLVLGTIISVRSWSDVLIACHAAPGVTVGALEFSKTTISRESPVFALWSFLCCVFGATLSMGCVTVFALLGVKMTIMLLILGLTMAYWHLESETLENVICLSICRLVLSCGCVLIGSVFPIFGLMMSFLKMLIETLVSSYLLYVALLLIVVMHQIFRNRKFSAVAALIGFGGPESLTETMKFK